MVGHTQRVLKTSHWPLHTRILFVLFITVLVPLRHAMCSGITVTSPTLGSLSGGSTTVSFNVSWNNSWRNATNYNNNWDAAWVFVKFRKNGGDWTHASLNDTGHTIPAGATSSNGVVDTSSAFNIATNPVAGVFIYRSADGTGTFTVNNVQLSWNYSQDGVTGADTVEVKVFAIEMVYIPNGAFFAGDNANATTVASLKQGSSDDDPWYIGSENAITTANAAGTGTGLAETAAEYYYVSDSYGNDSGTGAAFTIPAAFPKGYGKFYMMKGEISQGQWVAFFNTLTSTQKSTRDITSSTGKNSDSVISRNNVSWTSGDATLPDQGGGATYEAVAVNYLSWADLTAYLDWAGLRPMSELEFERASRGPQRAVSGEYAWGTTSITGAASISSGGTATEAPGAAANCVYGNYGSVQGPMRVGAMAYGDSTRIESGAGYYGNMDLSGNLHERVVPVGNATAHAFEGRYHGNGALDASGDPNVSTWPGTSAAGSGIRGGCFSTPGSSWDGKTSDRNQGARVVAVRSVGFGGRGVRTAP